METSGKVPTADAALLQQVAAHDTAALGELLRRYQAKIYGMALGMLRNPHDAEEALQDVAWTLFRKAGSFQGRSAVSSWLYRITMNACLMKLRRRPKVPMIPLEEELGPQMNDEGMTVELVADWSHLPRQEVERRELAARLDTAIERLPAEYRAVFVLRDVEGMSTQEVCASLELSEPALKSRLHRARLFLRKQLADYVAARQPAAEAREL